ncbi:MAG: cytochrome c oxidase accessory protein CcoG [Tepidisphaerales bacterium]
MASEQTLLQPEERVLSTLEADGSRRWLYPRLSAGRYWQARRLVAYALIAIFTLIPYITINGKPAMLLDILHRRFTLFGYTFLPTDTALLAVFMLMVLLSIFAITAVLGRVWCGWACPQTVYMEYLFRPIERLVMGRAGTGGKPQNVAGWRMLLTFALSIVACLYLAHTFLAYFVGVAQLRVWVTQSPFDHPAAFVVMAVVTGLMVFDFLYFREQTCIIACPYGRLQSVLLDKSSLIVSYDTGRGEPRGKLRKSLPIAEKQGDCIDCDMCVQVCPTGIDIRGGLQVECIGCTQCIDACDAVMDKIGRPRGLVRYTSQAALAGEKTRIIRPRVAIYAVLVLGLLTFLTILLATKSPADVTLLRQTGSPFLIRPTGQVENIIVVKIANRLDEPQEYAISLLNQPKLSVETTDRVVRLAPGQLFQEPVHVLAPRDVFDDGEYPITVRVTTPDGHVVDRPFRMLGPLGVPVAPAAGKGQP